MIDIIFKEKPVNFSAIPNGHAFVFNGNLFIKNMSLEPNDNAICITSKGTYLMKISDKDKITPAQISIEVKLV